jgi:hypothetical protein
MQSTHRARHQARAQQSPHLVDKFLSAKFESHAEQEQVALSRLPLRLSDQWLWQVRPVIRHRREKLGLAVKNCRNIAL